MPIDLTDPDEYGPELRTAVRVCNVVSLAMTSGLLGGPDEGVRSVGITERGAVVTIFPDSADIRTRLAALLQPGTYEIDVEDVRFYRAR